MTDIERIELEHLERILYPPVMLTPEMEAIDEAMRKMSFEQIAEHNIKAIAAEQAMRQYDEGCEG